MRCVYCRTKCDGHEFCSNECGTSMHCGPEDCHWLVKFVDGRPVSATRKLELSAEELSKPWYAQTQKLHWNDGVVDFAEVYTNYESTAITIAANLLEEHQEKLATAVV